MARGERSGDGIKVGHIIREEDTEGWVSVDDAVSHRGSK